MFEKLVAQITLALLGWLDRKMERGSVAMDADPDRDSLRRAGSRLREWMREQDNLRAGRVTDEGGTKQPPDGVPPNQR